MPQPAPHTKLYLALKASTPLLLAGGIAIAAEDSHDEWRCGAAADGNWSCTQVIVPGRSYPRPFHPEPTLTAEEGPQVRRPRNMDWIAEEDLTEEERQLIKPGCCGAYIEPGRDYPESDLAPPDASLRVSASSTEVLQEGVAKLEGSVQVNQGYRQLRSSSATVDRNKRSIQLDGQVLFREPGLLIEGENAALSLDTGKVNIDNVAFVMHKSGVRGLAKKLYRDENGDFVIDNAAYTTCEPGSNAWLLDSSELRIDAASGVATAKHTKVRIQGVPVLYLPWAQFPIGNGRTSGLLFPSLEVSEENGLDFAQPIYLNLAPNYDATITPRYLAERGAMLEVEGRYLNSWGQTVVSAAYLPNDDGGDNSNTAKSHAGKDRWLGSIFHEGGANSNWFSLIDYTEVSDEDFFRDIGNASLDVNSQTHLEQYTSVGYRNDNWRLTLATEEFQTLFNIAQEQYQIRPSLEADGYYRFGGFSAELTNHYASFEHTDSNLVQGDRVRLDYSLSWDVNWTWGYFKPTVMGKYLHYKLDNAAPGQDDNPSVTVPVGIIDTGIYFERDAGSDLLHTFEPRLYYLYSEYEDQDGLPNFDSGLRTFSYEQLFSDDRFVGGDRIGDSEHLSLGLTTRLLQASTGREWLRASIGQITYFSNRKVSLNHNLTTAFLANPNLGTIADLQQRLQAEDDLNRLLEDESSYAGELVMSLGRAWTLRLDGLYNSERGELDKGNVALRYNDGNNRLFNVGYRFTNQVSRVAGGEQLNNDIEQADLAMLLPLFGSWSLIAKWQYDITNERDLETFAGFEYDSCCWRISVVARRWLDQDDTILIPERDLDQDSGVFLQIQLKGLGGTGTRVDKILSDGIQGYQRSENTN